MEEVKIYREMIFEFQRTCHDWEQLFFPCVNSLISDALASSDSVRICVFFFFLVVQLSLSFQLPGTVDPCMKCCGSIYHLAPDTNLDWLSRTTMDDFA